MRGLAGNPPPPIHLGRLEVLLVRYCRVGLDSGILRPGTAHRSGQLRSLSMSFGEFGFESQVEYAPSYAAA